MKKTSAVISIVIAISAGALLTGCVVQPSRPSESQYTQYYDAQGTIQDIELISTGAAQTTGAGAVGGAIIGGILGHQVGKGTGKTLATVAGAAAGAYGGNEAEKSYAGRSETYRITVRTRDGRLLSYVQDDVRGLRIGDRVRVSQNRVYADY